MNGLRRWLPRQRKALNSGPVGRRFKAYGDLGGFRRDEDMREPEAKPLPAGVEGHRADAWEVA